MKGVSVIFTIFSFWCWFLLPTEKKKGFFRFYNLKGQSFCLYLRVVFGVCVKALISTPFSRHKYDALATDGSLEKIQSIETWLDFMSKKLCISVTKHRLKPAIQAQRETSVLTVSVALVSEKWCHVLLPSAHSCLLCTHLQKTIQLKTLVALGEFVCCYGSPVLEVRTRIGKAATTSKRNILKGQLKY